MSAASLSFIQSAMVCAVLVHILCSTSTSRESWESRKKWPPGTLSMPTSQRDLEARERPVCSDLVLIIHGLKLPSRAHFIVLASEWVVCGAPAYVSAFRNVA